MAITRATRGELLAAAEGFREEVVKLTTPLERMLPATAIPGMLNAYHRLLGAILKLPVDPPHQEIR